MHLYINLAHTYLPIYLQAKELSRMYGLGDKLLTMRLGGVEGNVWEGLGQKDKVSSHTRPSSILPLPTSPPTYLSAYE